MNSLSIVKKIDKELKELLDPIYLQVSDFDIKYYPAGRRIQFKTLDGNSISLTLDSIQYFSKEFIKIQTAIFNFLKENNTNKFSEKTLNKFNNFCKSQNLKCVIIPNYIDIYNIYDNPVIYFTGLSIICINLNDFGKLINIINELGGINEYDTIYDTENLSIINSVNKRYENLIKPVELNFDNVEVLYYPLQKRISINTNHGNKYILLEVFQKFGDKYKKIYKEILDFLEEKCLLKFSKYNLYELNKRNRNLKNKDYILSFDESNDCKDVIIRFISPQVDYIYLDDFETLIKIFDEFSE